MPEHKRAGPAPGTPRLAQYFHLLGGWPGIEQFQNAHCFLKRHILDRPGIHIGQREEAEIVSRPGADAAYGDKAFLHILARHVGKRVDIEPAAGDLIGNADWEKLVEPDDDIEARIKEVEDQISSLKESLQEVQRMNRRF